MKTSTTLSVSVSITILKPAAEVFAAVRNPTPFFVAKASAPLAEGETVRWKFPEVDTEVPVIVESVAPNDLIRFEWDSGAGGRNTCEFRFAGLDERGRKAAEKQGLNPAVATTVTVTESGWPDSEEGRRLSYGNQMGWTHMLCSMKAWLEHRVNLRTGAFLHHKF